MARRAFSDRQLLEAAEGKDFVHEVVEALGNTTRRTVMMHLTRLEHPLALERARAGVNRGRNKTPLDELLSYGTARNTVNLKNRLFDEGLKERKCERCGLTEWLGEPAPLQLDHKDGNRLNNLLENLRILCPNCHAQTDTYCGKNISRLRKRT